MQGSLLDRSAFQLVVDILTGLEQAVESMQPKEIRTVFQDECKVSHLLHRTVTVSYQLIGRKVDDDNDDNNKGDDDGHPDENHDYNNDQTRFESNAQPITDVDSVAPEGPAATLATTPEPALPRDQWGIADMSAFVVRGPTYLDDKVKVPAGNTLFDLVAVDVWQVGFFFIRALTWPETCPNRSFTRVASGGRPHPEHRSAPKESGPTG